MDVSAITGRYIGFDLETRDPGLKERGAGWAFNEGYPIGYALSWFDGRLEDVSEADLRNPMIRQHFKSVYLGFRHEGDPNNLSESDIRSIIGPLVSDPTRVMVAANVGYDYGWTRWDGFDFKAEVDDIQIQAPLLNDTKTSYRLEVLAKELLGIGKTEDALMEAGKTLLGLPPKEVKANLWRLPSGVVAEYAGDDAEHALRIHAIQNHHIRERDLSRVHQLERQLVPVLYAMRKNGVRVDVERAEKLRDSFWEKEQAFNAQFQRLTRLEVGVWEVQAQIDALKAEGIEEFPKTEKKGDDSLDAGFLHSLEKREDKAGEIAKAILGMRRYQRARVTFVENMVLESHKNGRIHCEFNALRSDDGGTVSGRFSSSKPNLQQVPARDPELGPLIRGIFLPEEGEVWMSIDYSSQEPRLAVHFGELAQLEGAKENGDVYRANPRADAYESTAELCNVSRKEAKIIRLGILYGMGGGKLADSLGLPTYKNEWINDAGEKRVSLRAGPEGRALLNRFNRNSPMDKALADLAQKVAKQRGFVKTAMGRQASFPKREDGSVWFTHKALNRIIQGSAADMMKQAMVNLFELWIGEGKVAPLTPEWRMLLTVHDELAFSVVPEKVKEIGEMLAEVMSTAIPLTVPVVCDVEKGATWGESMEKG